MSRAKIVLDSAGKFYGIRFNCPGCATHHEIGFVTLPVRWRPAGNEESSHVTGLPHWDFNGDFDKPTFSPSVLQRADYPRGPFVCHSFVRDGRIEFLGDCTHALAGQTVDLPEIEGGDN